MFKQFLESAFPMIEKIAPTVATALGSPLAGAGTSYALDILGNAFGVKQTELNAAIESNPESENILKQVETNFLAFLKNNQLKMPLSIEINMKINWDNTNSS